MASSRYSVAVVLLLCACAHERRFPAAAPLAQDTDMRPVHVRCRKEPNKHDPHHFSCAPELYVSPIAWDAIDNSTMRPLTRALSLRRSGEAVNVNSFDEVPDSSWFTNKLGTRAVDDAELRRGACEDAQVIDATDVPPGSWTIDSGKMNGSTPGFRVTIPGKGHYLFKTDAQETGVPSERPSASSTIGARIYALLGFNSSCEQVVYVKAETLRLEEGLTYSDNFERTYPFDQAALQKVFDGTLKRGEYMRFLASAWLPGHLIGPFEYHGTRHDDPNDVIPHEKRRDLRGARLIAAWINHFDSREQNSMDSWIASDPARGDDSSPGYVRHFYLDTSDSLGGEWVYDEISRRLGMSYVLDWGDVGFDFITLGTQIRAWENVARRPGYETFGYFNADDFVPEKWKSIYQNPSFSEMSEHDGAWMARKMAYITPPLVRALAETGVFTDPALTDYLTDVLEKRLAKILSRYLTRLSPVGAVALAEDGQGFCGTDFARWRDVVKDATYRYSAHMRDHDGRSLQITTGEDGRVCVALQHVTGEPYFVVRLTNGVVPGPLDVHIYDRGDQGFLIAGLTRPDHDE